MTSARALEGDHSGRLASAAINSEPRTSYVLYSSIAACKAALGTLMSRGDGMMMRPTGTGARVVGSGPRVTPMNLSGQRGNFKLVTAT